MFKGVLRRRASHGMCIGLTREEPRHGDRRMAEIGGGPARALCASDKHGGGRHRDPDIRAILGTG